MATVASPASYSCTFLGPRVALDPRSLAREGRVPGDFQRKASQALRGSEVYGTGREGFLEEAV